MQSSSETALAVRHDQDSYREQGQSLLGRGVSSLTRPIGEMLHRSVPVARVAQALRQIDDLAARIDFDQGAHDLDDLDQCRHVALSVERWARVANGATGGTAGIGGVLTMVADIPATMAVAMRNIRETGRAYGYEGDGEAEQLFRLRILELAAIDDDATRQDRIGELEAELADDGSLEIAEEHVDPLIDQAVERIARALAFSFARSRLGAGLPLLGAVVGAAVNASFQGDVSRAARFAFQARRLAAAPGDVTA